MATDRTETVDRLVYQLDMALRANQRWVSLLYEIRAAKDLDPAWVKHLIELVQDLIDKAGLGQRIDKARDAIARLEIHMSKMPLEEVSGD